MGEISSGKSSLISFLLDNYEELPSHKIEYRGLNINFSLRENKKTDKFIIFINCTWLSKSRDNFGFLSFLYNISSAFIYVHDILHSKDFWLFNFTPFKDSNIPLLIWLFNCRVSREITEDNKELYLKSIHDMEFIEENDRIGFKGKNNVNILFPNQEVVVIAKAFDDRNIIFKNTSHFICL